VIVDGNTGVVSLAVSAGREYGETTGEADKELG
jgi:hypothetical protein